MLNSCTLCGQEFRDPLEVLLAVRLEGTDDGIPVSHDFYRNVGKIGGPERVLDMHDLQVLVDAAQACPLSQPRQAISRLMKSCDALGRNDRTWL